MGNAQEAVCKAGATTAKLVLKTLFYSSLPVAGPGSLASNRQRGSRRTVDSVSHLAARVSPPVSRVQHRQHRAPLRALADLGRSRQQLRLAAAQPVHRHEHELAVERVDDLRAF